MMRNTQTSRLQREIDENLKKAFDDVAQQDVPDRFSKLLAELREKEKASGKESSGD